MTDDHDPTRTEGEGETLDMPEGLGTFTKGQILGERYQILEMLGRGGMGEVWHAFDLKLRVEVALKALRPEFFKSERRLDMLRQEVRAAREVMSPNVCRIFDLEEVDGKELVSMEYVDGATLLAVLHERGPLELKEAQDIASQFLAGLEAIHKVGLVHRDIKPENIMLTRAGRVVVMDFGLARQEEEGGGSVAGTPAYMSPEQAAGQTLDPRADVYSAGVVLAEMVSPDGINDLQSRQSVWEGVRSEPAKIPDTPWAKVIEKAVARDREHRFNTAHTLTRALEDVTLRVEGADDLHPYPGLSSFTEDDAEYFFGREAEVEQLWRKLEGPPRLLGLVGPSGAGKTSLLRAGVIPSRVVECAIVRCTPGTSAMASLRQALVPALGGDTEALGALAGGDDAATITAWSRWRAQHGKAMLIVDQFEELFTLNPADAQRRYAEVLNRLPVEADVHVMVSMRDDFLMECNRFEVLRPIVSDLTLVDRPTGANLRRALVQPATKCGYRFEDDELVAEMLAEVEGERGALPLLAFAAARLWDKRDREKGLLTRQAYHDIGGVGGALARHAEATLEKIGVERLPIVRELLRNLVTADGTRAIREWNELLSVFGDSQSGSPEEVLRALIDARLLTSYEVREEDKEPTRMVEIIHESLLANWPRLVRWQTQDADAAQLRDQLRQAARTWDEHDRSDDLLWTGAAYREYAVWRENYPGGLTEIEEGFSSAMTRLAKRRRRRRRIAAVSILIIAIVVTGVTTALWRRSVLHERRAEAQKLIALGQVRMVDYPTAALAHAIQSLEVSDSEQARFLALEALWEGPTAFIVNESPTLYASFSVGGDWLVQNHDFMSSLAVISRKGMQTVVDHPSETGTTRTNAFFSGSEELFCTLEDSSFALWSTKTVKLLASSKTSRSADSWGGPPVIDDSSRVPRALYAEGEGENITVHELRVDGSARILGEFRLDVLEGEGGVYCLDPEAGDWITVVEGSEVSIMTVGENRLSDRLPLGRHEGEDLRCFAEPLGRFFLTVSEAGSVRKWDPSGNLPPSDLRLPAGSRIYSVSSTDSYLAIRESRDQGKPEMSIWSFGESGLNLARRFNNLRPDMPDFDPIDRRLVMRGPLPSHRLWSLAAPAGAEPMILRRGPSGYTHWPSFSPDGRWLATSDRSGLALWPLARTYPDVINVDFKPWSYGVAFGPDGKVLAMSAGSEARVWPLVGAIPPAGHVVLNGTTLIRVAASPDGETYAAGVGSAAPAVLIGKKGEEPIELPSAEPLDAGTNLLSFSPDGKLVAAVDGQYDVAKADFRVWDVATRQEIAVLHLDGEEFRDGPGFIDNGRLLTGSTKGVVSWDVDKGNHEVLVELRVQRASASGDGRYLLVTEEGENQGLQGPAGCPRFFDLDTGTSTHLSTHGLDVRQMALDKKATIAVTADSDGVIRVGPTTGEEPHLLLGHDGLVLEVAIDPLGRWIASAGMDQTLRLWPMPDLSKPPLHTLPREKLIAKLKTLTNLRVVRDEGSPTGWKLTHDPFPGWETVPTW